MSQLQGFGATVTVPTSFQRGVLTYLASRPLGAATSTLIVNHMATSFGGLTRSAALMKSYGWITYDAATYTYTITAAGRSAVGAPLPPPPPTDFSGATARVRPLYPYRAQFFAATSYWKRKIPSPHPLFQDATYPDANSLNWRNSLCKQMGFNSATPQSQPYPSHLPGDAGSYGRAWLGRESQHLYIVPDDQPLRSFTNISGYTSSARFNANVARLGGLPVPLDVTAHQTADKYLHVYQPSKNLFVSLYGCAALDPAYTTLSTQGSPSSGAVTLRLWYGDNEITPAWWTTAPIPYNATAAQLDAIVDAATNPAGAVLGDGNANRCMASGGPLPAPIRMDFAIATPNEAARVEVIASTLNQGNVVVVEHPSGPLDRCRAGGLLAPNPANPGGVSAAHGTYIDRTISGTYYEDKNWGGAATSMEFMAGYPEAEEVRRAQANGTGLDHAIVLNVGHAQTIPIPWIYPANRSDGDMESAGYICEGAHVALPQDVDLSYCESVAPEWTWVLRTLRDYGAFVPDKTGSGCGLNFRRAAFPGSTYNPWYDLLPKYQGPAKATASHDYMAIIPWHRAEIIDPDVSRLP